MRGRPPLSAGRIHQIHRLRARGHSIRWIARELGISPGTVHRYSPLGGQPHHYSTPEERQQAVDMYRRGLMLREIACQLRRSHETVRGWLLAAGVVMHKRGSRSPF